MNIVEYLESQSQQGEFQGTRDFTINSLKARHKLSESQLAAPGLWLVKLVQCAVRLEAEGVAIKTGRRLVELEFSVAQGPSAERIARHLLDGSLPSEPALSHLLTGLRASLAGHAESMVCLVEGSMQSTTLRVTQDGTEVLQCPSNVGEGVRYAFTISRPRRPIPLSDIFRTSIKGVLNNLVDELRAVETRCWCAPLPVSIDNRRIDQPFPSNETRYLADVDWLGAPANRDLEHGDHWFAVRWFDVPGCAALAHLDPSFEPQVPRKTKWWAVKARQEVFLDYPRGEENSVFFLSATKSVRSGIDFVLDGAVVLQTTLEFDRISAASAPFRGMRLALRIFRAVSLEELDLSHFQLRHQSRLVNDTLLAAAEPFRETLRSLEAQVARRWPTFTRLLTGESDLMTKGLLLLTAPMSLPSSVIQFSQVQSLLAKQGQRILASFPPTRGTTDDPMERPGKA